MLHYRKRLHLPGKTTSTFIQRRREAVWKVVFGGYFATLAGMRKPYQTDLSDAEWNYIEPHLPTANGYGRPRIHSLREILNAIFYLLRSGCQWRMLPHEFPRWPTVYHYFRKWRIDGTWVRINTAIRERLRIRMKREPQPSAGTEWIASRSRLLEWAEKSAATTEERRSRAASATF